jgi:hypothetical protein
VKANGKPYEGNLRQPIVLPDHRAWALQRKMYGERALQHLGPAAQEQDERVRAAAESARIPELFDHFAISSTGPDAWRLLAIALARTHVPGFATVRGRGAPVTRDAQVKYLLYKLARRKRNDLSARGSVTQNQVCAALANDRDFKRQIPELAMVSPKSLANELTKAHKIRRASIEHLWNVRATLRRLSDVSGKMFVRFSRNRPGKDSTQLLLGRPAFQIPCVTRHRKEALKPCHSSLSMNFPPKVFIIPGTTSIG